VDGEVRSSGATEGHSAGDLDRRAARILLVDPEGRLLLFCMHDPERPERGEWWITPGGGVEGSESFEDAGRRELFEETGIVAAELGPMIYEAPATWMWGERLVRQHPRFFVVSTASTTIVTDGWEESEKLTTLAHRWWTVEELTSATQVILPENLAILALEAVRIACTR
jgi:8-oxo-dGTP pyrophosphatase MutT (NUDIX family)